MPIAQKFPTKEPYGCGIPLAGTSARAGSVDRIRRAGCHPAAFFLLTRRNRPSSPPPHIRFFHNSRKNSCIFQTTCYNNPHGTQSAPYFGPLAQLGERMVLKAGPENAPHPPIPFCIKKFRKHQKFGPLAQLGERKVRNLEVRGSIPLRSTIQEATRLGGFFVFSEVRLRSIVQCAVTVKCRFYTNLIQLEKLPKHRPQNRSVLRFFIYKSESKR